MSIPVAAIVLAAGQGKRMNSDLPKVLHPVLEKPMLGHILETLAQLEVRHTLTVVGHRAEVVEQYLQAEYPHVQSVFAEPRGTGYAVRACADALKDFQGDVLIINGDCPLITAELLEDLRLTHQKNGYSVSFISTMVENPTGLGRVLRDNAGQVQGIVEEKDASDAEKKLHEINTGLYIAKAPQLFALLQQVTNANTQGEYYLTDIIKIARAEGAPVGTFTCANGEALMGVNTLEQLAHAEALLEEGELSFPPFTRREGDDCSFCNIPLSATAK